MLELRPRSSGYLDEDKNNIAHDTKTMKGIASITQLRYGLLSLASLVLSVALIAPVHGHGFSSAEVDGNFTTIKALLEKPNDQIDLAEAKITIDKMLDPSIDIAKSLLQLNDMAKRLRATLPLVASNADKLEALRKFLYVAGSWNLDSPFTYDMDDPFGANLRNKLLSTYLESRKGNCVSMPILFVILGQKIGLDVTLSTAPSHSFVKYLDETGKLYNIEATSGGGFARDTWVRQQNPMTDRAIQTGIYMQPLSKKEAVVQMVGTVLEFYGANRLRGPRVRLALLALQHAPKYVDGLLHIASVYEELAHESIIVNYNNTKPSMSQRMRYQQLQNQAAERGGAC